MVAYAQRGCLKHAIESIAVSASGAIDLYLPTNEVKANVVQRIANSCHSGYFNETIAFEFLTVVVEVI